MPELTSLHRARLLLAATPLLPFLVAVPGFGWALPLLAPLTVCVWFARRVRLGDQPGAWRLVLGWAALLALGSVAAALLMPDAAGRWVPWGAECRLSLLHWVAAGGPPASGLPALLVRHAVPAVLVAILAGVSGGYLALAALAGGVACISVFAAAFGAESGLWLSGSLVAWLPWELLRVASLALLATVLARPLLVRRPWPFRRREAVLVALALSGLLGVVILELSTAPRYADFLHRLLTG